MAYADGSSSGTGCGGEHQWRGEFYPADQSCDRAISTAGAENRGRHRDGSGQRLGSLQGFQPGFGPLVAQGAAVTEPMRIGNFGPVEIVPGSTNDCGFGDIAVGPQGQVMVAYQNLFDTTGAATIYVSVDADGLGPNPFAARWWRR